MKLFLTVGEDAAGNLHLLYLGRDGDHAYQAMEHPPENRGIVKTGLFKKPSMDRRRLFSPSATPPASENPAGVTNPDETIRARELGEGETNAPESGDNEALPGTETADPATAEASNLKATAPKPKAKAKAK